jgi:hypothetical protein
MPHKYDPYRERLVMETSTLWAVERAGLDDAGRGRISLEMHEHPDAASQLQYIRTHTGFCRQITVTEADLVRLGVR